VSVLTAEPKDASTGMFILSPPGLALLVMAVSMALVGAWMPHVPPAIGLTVLVGAVTLASQRAALLGLAALLPLVPAYWAIDLGRELPILNVQRVLLWMFALALLARLCTYDGRRLLSQALANTSARRIAVIAVLWTLWVAISGAGHGMASLGRSVNQIVYWMAPFAGGWLLLGDPLSRRRFALALLLGAVLVSGVGVYEKLSGVNPFAGIAPPRVDMVSAQALMRRSGAMRVEATLGHPIGLAMYLILAIPFVGVLPGRALRWGVATLLALVLLWTVSRGPLLALGAALVLLNARHVGRVAGGIVAAFVLVVQPLVFQGVVAPLRAALTNITVSTAGRVYSADSEAAFAAASRIQQLVDGTAYVVAHWLTGGGVGRGMEVSGLSTIDNYFLLAAIESGVVASLLFALLAMTIVFALRRKVRIRTLDPVRRSALLSIVGFSLGLVLVSLKQTIPLFFMVLGMATGIATGDDRGADAIRV
jgi:hypothetical protein